MPPVISTRSPRTPPLRKPPVDSGNVHAIAYLFSGTRLESIPRSLSTSAYQPLSTTNNVVLESLHGYRSLESRPWDKPQVRISPAPSLLSMETSGAVRKKTVSHSASTVLKTITHILRNNGDNKECDVFSRVSYKHFISLSRIIESSSEILRKPKLSYFVKQQVLMAQWPSRVHDAPAEELIILFRQHESAAYSQPDFQVNASTSRPIIHKYITAIPDLTVTCSSVKAKVLKHLFVFECAFSQPADQLFAKVKKLVKGLPDLQMVFILRIQERNNFHSPDINSPAWDLFESDPSPLELPQFLQLVDDEAKESPKNNQVSERPPEEFTGPVFAGGHVWCDISRVQYYVWVRDGDGKLEIDPKSMKQTQWSAYGELPVPDDGSDMEHVGNVVNNGLAQIRAAIAQTHRDVCKQLQIPVDATVFAMPITLPESWNHFCSALKEAKFHTAFERYQVWYFGVKHTLSDSDYSPSPSDQEDQDSESHKPRGKRVEVARGDATITTTYSLRSRANAE